LRTTYGKTIHTWQFDIHPDFPLGPPNLMMAYTRDSQLPPNLVKDRDERYNYSTEQKRQLRSGYLPPDFKKSEKADQWVASGQGISFEPKQVSVTTLDEL